MSRESYDHKRLFLPNDKYQLFNVNTSFSYDPKILTTAADFPSFWTVPSVTNELYRAIYYFFLFWLKIIDFGYWLEPTFHVWS